MSSALRMCERYAIDHCIARLVFQFKIVLYELQLKGRWYFVEVRSSVEVYLSVKTMEKPRV